MIFSAAFLEMLVYGSLIWCALSAVGLAALLIRDLVKGQSW